MFTLITEIKDQDGGNQASWSTYETREEARTAFKLAQENPSLSHASVSKLIVSTDYPNYENYEYDLLD